MVMMTMTGVIVTADAIRVFGFDHRILHPRPACNPTQARCI